MNRILALILCLGILAGCTTAPSIIPVLETPTPTPIFPTFTPTQDFTPAPLPTLTPLPACTESAGHTETFSIPAEPLDGELEFIVYYPPCYRVDIPSGYPVLYLLHGQGSSAGLWLKLGLAETADALIAAGEIPPLLVVMPTEKDYLENPFESDFGAAVTGGLVPWVDAGLPVCSGRGCRAIGGLSRGACWALNLGLDHWETFGSIGGHSMPTFYGDITRLNGWVRDIPPDEFPRLWLDIGDRDPYLKSAAGFEARLTELGVTHEWHLWSGGHDAGYWGAHLEEYLRWYAAGWQISSGFEDCDICDLGK